MVFLVPLSNNRLHLQLTDNEQMSTARQSVHCTCPHTLPSPASHLQTRCEIPFPSCTVKCTCLPSHCLTPSARHLYFRVINLQGISSPSFIKRAISLHFCLLLGGSVWRPLEAGLYFDRPGWVLEGPHAARIQHKDTENMLALPQ